MMKNKVLQLYLIPVLTAGFLGGVVGATLSPSLSFNPLANKTITLNGRQGIQIIERETLASAESAITAAVEQASSSVVSIIDTPKSDPLMAPTEKKGAVGSGFIVSPDGRVVTNAHVVSDPSANYSIVTKGGKVFPVQKIIRNQENDIAILKVSAENLPALKLGDSKSVKPGQRVITIGTPLGTLSNSVTVGVVSALGRNITVSDPFGIPQISLGNLIQIDAALNPGNSGGPALNLSGEVIGINFAVTQGAQNIGFAIPANTLKKIINDLPEGEKFKIV